MVLGNSYRMARGCSVIASYGAELLPSCFASRMFAHAAGPPSQSRAAVLTSCESSACSGVRAYHSLLPQTHGNAGTSPSPSVTGPSCPPAHTTPLSSWAAPTKHGIPPSGRLVPWLAESSLANQPAQRGYASSDASRRRLKAAHQRRTARTAAPRRSMEVARTADNQPMLSSPIDLPALLWNNDSRAEIAPAVGHRALVICREIEWANIIIGFEQANKYTVRDERGEVVAYIAEETPSIGNAIGRQLLSTHRNFVATVFDAEGNVMLKVRRPFYFINSQMNIEGPSGEVVGEVIQRWHLWKRNYDLYMGKRQFASITGSFLAWEFELKDENGGTLALIDRNFLGFGREIFTDAGKYVIHFGMPAETAAEQASVSRQALIEKQTASSEASAPITMLAKLRTDVSIIPTQTGDQLAVARTLSLSERAIALACAITIDFDYFSQHSGRSGVLGYLPFIPMPMPVPVPSPDAAGAAGDVAGAAGDAAGGASGTAGGLGGAEAPPSGPELDLGGDEFQLDEPPASEGFSLQDVFDFFDD